MTSLCGIYIGGTRIPCAYTNRATPEELAALSDFAAEAGACLAAARTPGPAPEGWTAICRGYAKPRSTQPEPLIPLTDAHRAAMRGLYALFAGRFGCMLTREDPEEWEARFARLKNPLGLFEGDRLLLWLDADGGNLLELSAAPDADERIPGALWAAGITRAPAPLLGVPAEECDEALKLRLIRPFLLPDGRVETAGQLACAAEDAVLWDG